MPDEKRPRPQNANLRKYGDLTDEQKADFHAKGGVARQQQRRLQKLIQAALNTGISVDALNEILCLAKMDPEKASNQSVKAGMAIALVNVDKAIMGDTEARNWVMTHAFPDEYEAYKRKSIEVPSQSVTPNPDPSGDDNELRIHLIRGEKPVEPEQEQNEEAEPATPSAHGSEV